MSALVVAVLVVAAAAIAVAVDRRRRAVDAPEVLHDPRQLLRERDLLAAEVALLRSALEALDHGIVVVDADGAELERNHAAAALADGRGSDVLVRTALDEALVEARRGVGVERTLELFGPPPRTLVLRALPLLGDEPEHIIGAVGLVEDITERQRLESVRRDFVANISHELRTPIGALGVLAEAMADADDPDTASRLAERMGDEIARVTRTIEDLLELSRIESADGRIGTQVAIGDVVAEAVERAHPVAEGSGIELVVVPASEQLEVRGDRRQLVSALFNLLDNAIKYSDPDRKVEVRAGRDGDEVTVEVVDHGIGIPAADLERVFERFYRVDAARRRTTGGTGLGLAIVRHVVANHGGEVTVRSRAGEGSTFTLRLPAARPAASAAEVS
jgi:two-component system sensor histidine kinase SenX3